TLDPTMRAISLPGVEKAILSDTVGFISDLPTQLVAAFRATLEEVTAADVVLHVRDMANPDSAAQKRQVLHVLAVLGLGEGEDDGEGEPTPIIEVWNKFDLLDQEQREALLDVAAHDDTVVPTSAVTGEGVDGLREHLGALLTKGARLHSITLPASDGAKIAWLHAHGEVLADEDGGEGEHGPLRHIAVRLTEKEWGRFEAL
ncbi:MAG: GTPase HflX, partial [Erythrobacter sp.]|nr:GTPase HflX [Erythrobacter sp.]